MSKRKFNYVDILVAVIIIVILIGGYLYMKKDTSGVTYSSNNVDVTFIAEALDVDKEVVQQLQVGDAVVASGTFQEAYITDIEILDANDLVAIDGEIQLLPSPRDCNIRVTISGKANQYGPYIDLGGQEIKSGSRYYIKTDVFEAYGYVVKILEDEE